jgi:hypothetical protein
MKLSKFLFEAIEDFQSKRFKDLESGAKKEEFNIKKASEGINTFEELKNIVDETDPTGGTYKRWLYDKWFGGGFKTEDKLKVKDYLNSFHANRTKLPKDFQDIGGIQTSGQLFAVLKDNGFIGLETSKIDPAAISKLEADGDIEPLGENSEWKGWILKTVKGSCALGKGTEWCTAKYREQDERNMFSRYHGEGPLYVFIRKTSGTPSKIQLHFQKHEFMNENDIPIGIPEDILNILAKNPNLFKDKDLLKHLTETDSILEISNEILINLVNNKNEKLDSVRYNIANNKQTPKDILAFLAMNEDLDIRKSVAGNLNTPKETLSNLIETETDPEFFELIVNNPNTPIATLKKLSENDNEKISELAIKKINLAKQIFNASKDEKKDIIQNSLTPIIVLEKLALDPSYSVRATVAINKNTPKKILEILAADSNINVVSSVMGNENLTKDILKIIAQSNNNPDILYQVVNHKQITPEILMIILAKKDIDNANMYSLINLFYSIAGNKKTPPEALHSLAKSDSATVRAAVANNINTAEKTLLMFSNDPNLEVRKNAISDRNQSANILKIFSKDKDKSIREIIANHENVTPEILNTLAKDTEIEILASVAGNEKTPLESLIILSNKKEDSILSQLAKNPKITIKILEKILNNLSDELFAFVLNRHVSKLLENSPRNSIKISKDKLNKFLKFVQKNMMSETDVKIFKILKGLISPQNLDPNTKIEMAENPNTSSEDLIDLSSDSDVSIRKLVASNENIPLIALINLAKDSNRDILKALVDNPRTPEKLANNLVNTYNLYESRKPKKVSLLSIIFNR